MSGKLLAVKGMNDVLPPESTWFEWMEAQARSVFARYAYQNIRTPIVEPTPLFVRGLGEVTDVVEKEMYSFEDRLNGDPLTLRPEATAGVVRAAVEHNLLYNGPRRLYYMGPMFRHERPQRGRYRQFGQIGAEALGFDGAEIDAELILMAHQLLSELRLEDMRLEINCLGQPAERLAHRQALIAYLKQRHQHLDADARRRLHSNPLRILDSKNPEMQAMLDEAPKMMDFLGEVSRGHFQRVLSILDANGIASKVNPRLVRGLDYYNLTVFEFVAPRLGITVCAGGRYDGLFAQLGGKSTPAVGWALGVERVVEIIKDSGAVCPAPAPDVYAVVGDWAAMPTVMAVLQRLRQEGVSVQMHTSQNLALASFKAQFKRADASGAVYALVFGADELASRSVAVKPLRHAECAQFSWPLADTSGLAGILKSPQPGVTLTSF